jgi:hypothetical protein
VLVAAVDIKREALANAHDHLGLPPERCYTDIARAFDENPADFCTIVVPPAYHEEIVDQALSHDLHILSEKPIADTLEASVRIADNDKGIQLELASYSVNEDTGAATIRVLRRDDGDFPASLGQKFGELAALNGPADHNDALSNIQDLPFSHLS